MIFLILALIFVVLITGLMVTFGTALFVLAATGFILYLAYAFVMGLMGRDLDGNRITNDKSPTH